MWYECVSTASDLGEGDHIKLKRLPGYDHHAIVERVDHEAGKVHIIKYGSDKRGSSFGKGSSSSSSCFSKGVVRRHKVNDMKRMYKYVYDKCDDTNTVLNRAKKKLDKQE